MRVYGPPSYREWGHRLPCVVVGCETDEPRPGAENIIECCHLHTGGTGRKDDWTRTFWACWRHHDESAAGRQRFEEAHELRIETWLDVIDVGSLAEACMVTQHLFEQWENGLAD